MAETTKGQSGRHERPSGLWPHVLDGATNEQDLVAIVRNYLATWSPEEIARLPVSCRPGKVIDGEDVSDYAFRLASSHVDFSGPLADRLLLERLMGFFTHAAARFAAMQATASSSSS